jgi:hypothetical protein
MDATSYFSYSPKKKKKKEHASFDQASVRLTRGNP